MCTSESMLHYQIAVNCQWSQPMQMNLDLPTPRAAHGMCTVGNNIYIFGGRDTEDRQNDLYCFDTGELQYSLEESIKTNYLQQTYGELLRALSIQEKIFSR